MSNFYLKVKRSHGKVTMDDEREKENNPTSNRIYE